jgi:hypothetical protein
MICAICGKYEKKTTNTPLGTLCFKHRGQYKTYGKILDNNPRTNKDLNEIVDNQDGTSSILLYDKYGNSISSTVIDTVHTNKVKNIKWRLIKKRDKTYVIGGSFAKDAKNKGIYLHRLILNYYGENEVDHIDGKELNNLESNLRIATRVENIYNTNHKKQNQYGVRGISYSQRENKYIVDFSFNKLRYYFKHFADFNEAVYLRYLCDITFKKEFRQIAEDDILFFAINKLNQIQKQNIEKYFQNKMAKDL